MSDVDTTHGHRRKTGRGRVIAQDVRRHDPNASKISPKKALPGETEPLAYTPGRGPITDDEILGVMRRQRRENKKATEKGNVARAEVPDELPPVTARKTAFMVRLPPYFLAAAKARAEVEGTNVTAIIEEHIIKYATGKPTAPATVTRRLREVWEPYE
ncbi:hypothetical protein GS504_01695 [Rhodococcus hoagii]|nr:hypothetical protein [Prescottella equi]